MKLIIKLFVIILIGLVAYNYFYGDEEEKETTVLVVDQAKQLGQSIWSMIKAEKDRFAEGKHQEIIDNIGSTIGILRENKEELDISEEDLRALEKDKIDLDSMLRQPNSIDSIDGSISEEARKKLRMLLEKIENLSRGE